MTTRDTSEIRFAKSRPLADGPVGLKDLPGRNDPGYGAFLIERRVVTRRAIPVCKDCADDLARAFGGGLE